MSRMNTSNEDRNILVLTIFAIFAYVGAFGTAMTEGHYNPLSVVLMFIAFVFTGLIVKEITKSIKN